MSTTATVLWLALTVMACGAVVAALDAVGASRWSASTQAMVAQLQRGRMSLKQPPYSVRELDGLPSPVQRYFRTVLTDGQSVVSTVTVRHQGSFNMTPGADRWKAFSSTQWVVVDSPGFVWNARIALLPGIAVNVHDAYLGGEGFLEPSLLGLVRLGKPLEPGVLAQGELIRFFAESAWYPTALLPRNGVKWIAVDEHSSTATLRVGDTAVTMLVSFNAGSLIESVSVEARGASVDGAMVMTPWEGRWSNYQVRYGMLIPLAGEAAWLGPGGRKPYWRGDITQITIVFN